MTKSIFVVMILSVTGLSGCNLTNLNKLTLRKQASPDAIVSQCQAEVAPAGTYQYTETTGLPVMVAVEDGTEQGAAVFNQCIRAKAVSYGLIADPRTSRAKHCPEGAPTLYGGATYCIGTN